MVPENTHISPHLGPKFLRGSEGGFRDINFQWQEGQWYKSKGHTFQNGKMKVPFFILKMESIAGADSITDKSSTCCLNLLTSLSVYVQLFVHSRLVCPNWWQHFRVIIIPEHCEEICCSSTDQGKKNERHMFNGSHHRVSNTRYCKKGKKLDIIYYN